MKIGNFASEFLQRYSLFITLAKLTSVVDKIGETTLIFIAFSRYLWQVYTIILRVQATMMHSVLCCAIMLPAHSAANSESRVSTPDVDNLAMWADYRLIDIPKSIKLMQVSLWWQVACRTDIVGKPSKCFEKPSITFHSLALFSNLPFHPSIFASTNIAK